MQYVTCHVDLRSATVSASFLEPVLSRTSSFVTWSRYVTCNILCMHRLWKTFNFCAIFVVIFHVSLAYIPTDTTVALYNHIFVSVLITDDVHIDRMRWNTEAALPVLQLTSASASPSHARANTIIRKFSSTSLSTKLLLFRAYCTQIYGAVSFGAPCSSIHIVSFMLHITMLSDNCYKNLDGVVHLNFLLNNVPTFSANIRKLVYSLYCSLRKSDNVCDVFTVLPLLCG